MAGPPSSRWAVRGAFLDPAVLLNTTVTMKVNCEEVFAPLVTVIAYVRLDEAIAAVNRSPFGLQAGVFSATCRRCSGCTPSSTWAA